jgi:hypothetical protein
VITLLGGGDERRAAATTHVRDSDIAIEVKPA